MELYLWERQPGVRVCSCFCQTPPWVLLVQSHFLILISLYGDSQPSQVAYIPTPKLFKDSLWLQILMEDIFLPPPLVPQPKPQVDKLPCHLSQGVRFSGPGLYSGISFHSGLAPALCWGINSNSVFRNSQKPVSWPCQSLKRAKPLAH